MGDPGRREFACVGAKGHADHLAGPRNTLAHEANGVITCDAVHIRFPSQLLVMFLLVSGVYRVVNLGGSIKCCFWWFDQVFAWGGCFNGYTKCCGSSRRSSRLSASSTCLRPRLKLMVKWPGKNASKSTSASFLTLSTCP